MKGRHRLRREHRLALALCTIAAVVCAALAGGLLGGALGYVPDPEIIGPVRPLVTDRPEPRLLPALTNGPGFQILPPSTTDRSTRRIRGEGPVRPADAPTTAAPVFTPGPVTTRRAMPAPHVTFRPTTTTTRPATTTTPPPAEPASTSTTETTVPSDPSTVPPTSAPTCPSPTTDPNTGASCDDPPPAF